VAPDSFKGTFTAREVAEAISVGIRSAGAAALPLPLADGGEGTLDVLAPALGLRSLSISSCNPWGMACYGKFGFADDGTALIEVAAVGALTAVHAGPRDPLAASTYGTGVLIAEAARRGARRILVAAGGSASTDGGSGAIDAIEERGGLRGIDVIVLADVRASFLDAATTYAPQKGANPDQVRVLRTRLAGLASTLPRDPTDIESAGAAGGFAGGMWACYGARITSGAEFVLDALGFANLLSGCDAVVTGEGRLDAQTEEGKVVSAVLHRSASRPVHAVVGSLDPTTDVSPFTTVHVASIEADMHAAGVDIVTAKP